MLSIADPLPSAPTTSAISQTQISNYIRLLIEFGDVYKVDVNNFIIGPDGKPITVLSTNGKASPIKIFHDGMTAGDWINLNPLCETLTHSADREWFWKSRSIIVGYLLKTMLQTLIEKLVKNPTNETFCTLELSRKIVADLDDKSVDSFEHILPEQFGAIEYNRKTKTATFVCALFDTAATTKLGKRVRKKDMTTLQTCLSEIFQTENPNTAFSATGTFLAAPEAHASLTVFTLIAELMAQYCEIILGIKIPIEELKAHFENLDKYIRLCSWYRTSAKKGSVVQSVLPWSPVSTCSTIGGATTPLSNPIPLGIQMVTHTLPQFRIPETPVTPVGMPVNPQGSLLNMRAPGPIPILPQVSPFQPCTFRPQFADVAPIRL